MKFAGIFVFLVFLSDLGFSQKISCLPADIKADSVVSAATIKFLKQKALGRVTVFQALKHLKARCSRGKLLEGRGKTIYFYRLQGCWGNPPADYLEILDRQKEEITKLKTKYTVIEMACDPGGTPPQSISKVFAFPEAQRE